MEACGEMKMITNIDELNAHVSLWMNDSNEQKPISYILSLEGADSIVTTGYLNDVLMNMVYGQLASHITALGVMLNGTRCHRKFKC